MRGMAPQGLFAIRELKTCQEASIFLLHEEYYDILALKKKSYENFLSFHSKL